MPLQYCVFTLKIIFFFFLHHAVGDIFLAVKCFSVVDILVNEKQEKIFFKLLVF